MVMVGFVGVLSLRLALSKSRFDSVLLVEVGSR
jgi:hypothetical protein